MFSTDPTPRWAFTAACAAFLALLGVMWAEISGDLDRLERDERATAVAIGELKVTAERMEQDVRAIRAALDREGR